MICVSEIIESNVADAEHDVIVVCLPYDERKKSRLKTTSVCGQELGFILPRGHVLRNDAVLKDELGRLIRVQSALEPISEVMSDNRHLLMRAAYHLGNRHVPLQIGETWLRYQHDHVLDDMLTGLGLHVIQHNKAFEPEDGAYRGHQDRAHEH